MKLKGYKEKYAMYDENSINQTKIIKSSKKNDVENKLVNNIDDLISKLDLHDGMTVSFHHHLRNGDKVVNNIFEAISNQGIKDITLFISAIFPVHEPLVKLIEDKTITKIYTAYMSGPVAEAVSVGKLENVAVFHTHGGRPRLLESEEVVIDVAFIAAPSSDKYGNMTGKVGPSACGSLGYSFSDAYFSKCAVAVTDNLVEEIEDVSISGDYINYCLVVDKIGYKEGIVSGTTQITKNPIGLRIASLTTEVIKHAGYFKEGFSFQTGAGGISLAVSKYLKELMEEVNIKGSFASGGITSAIVQMFEDNLFEKLYDVQCFDEVAVDSISKNKNHIEISASRYANINDNCIVNDLDYVILGATEIDLNFNVNVITSSTGEIMGGSGGHSDTAAGANVTIIVSQLFNSRIPVIKDTVTTITTPGSTVDVLVTERGIAVNPSRMDIYNKLKAANLPVLTIEELKIISDKLTGVPDKISFTDEPVAVVEYRDGSLIDVIYKKAKMQQ